MTPKTEYTIAFPSLKGGLVLSKEYGMESDESPAMKNLLWVEGSLRSRRGQEKIYDTSFGTGYSCHSRLWANKVISHFGTKLYADNAEIYSGVPQYKGSFFEYNGFLYYKTRGAYLKISSSLQVSAVVPYVPTILIDADPDTGSGSYYQSENRLSPDKKVIYTATNKSQFHLPIRADSIISVSGTTTAWMYSAGIVTFAAPVSGSIEITYRKANSDALNSIMDCGIAVVYSPITIVMAGCPAQPNAYFWNSNDSIAMNPGYFPMETYNLAGDSGDPITGFGQQQSGLVIFKERSVGKTMFGTAEIDGRNYIDLPYTAINSVHGCLPGTVQLIGNNLVWANSKGIFYLTDTTDAGENCVELISRKLGETEFNNAVSSYDDGSRYYLICSTGEAWVWDYSISTYRDPSWFYLTDIEARAFCGEDFITGDGCICRITDSFSDFGEPIEKAYRFATQNFGGYDRIVNVNSVLISIRNDSNSVTELRYISDKENRKDQADLENVAWLLTPRNLSFRCLAGRRFAKVFRRRPHCRRIHHFTMELSNNNLGEDLSIVSAAVNFYYEGRMKYNP